MATITPTPANIRVGARTQIGQAVAGEAIEQFDLIYQSGTGELFKAINTSAAAAKVVGVAITKSAIGGIVAFVPPGTSVASSSALWTKGHTYVVSGTAGRMMDAGDIVAGQFVTVVGIADSTTTLIFKPIVSWIAA